MNAQPFIYLFMNLYSSFVCLRDFARHVSSFVSSYNHVPLLSSQNETTTRMERRSSKEQKKFNETCSLSWMMFLFYSLLLFIQHCYWDAKQDLTKIELRWTSEWSLHQKRAHLYSLEACLVLEIVRDVSECSYKNKNPKYSKIV